MKLYIPTIPTHIQHSLLLIYLPIGCVKTMFIRYVVIEVHLTSWFMLVTFKRFTILQLLLLFLRRKMYIFVTGISDYGFIYFICLPKTKISSQYT